MNNLDENTALPVIDMAGCPAVDRINDSEQLIRGVNLFLDNGFLVIKNAFEAGFVQNLHDEYVKKYESYFLDKQYSDAANVGDKRTMVTIAFEGVFNSTQFYANPVIYQLMSFLLGSRFILNSLGSVLSLPGSRDQHIHRDAPNIYVTPTNRSPDFSWLKYTPPYAVTLTIPLVPITQLTGNTRFWPGTHLRNVKKDDTGLGIGVDYTADLGTCVLFDYRVLHAGLANNSDIIRPLIYNVYSRPWFRDTVNFVKQDSLSITVEQFRSIPKNYHHLFEWALAR